MNLINVSISEQENLLALINSMLGADETPLTLDDFTLSNPSVIPGQDISTGYFIIDGKENDQVSLEEVKNLLQDTHNTSITITPAEKYHEQPKTISYRRIDIRAQWHLRALPHNPYIWLNDFNLGNLPADDEALIEILFNTLNTRYPDVPLKRDSFVITITRHSDELVKKLAKAESKELANNFLFKASLVPNNNSLLYRPFEEGESFDILVVTRDVPEAIVSNEPEDDVYEAEGFTYSGIED